MNSRCTWRPREDVRKSTTPPSAACSACRASGWCHCRRPWLTPRRCTDQAPHHDQGQSGGSHGRRNDPIAAQFLVMRGPHGCRLFASLAWPRHTGCSLEALDMDPRAHLYRNLRFGNNALFSNGLNGGKRECQNNPRFSCQEAPCRLACRSAPENPTQKTTQGLPGPQRLS